MTLVLLARALSPGLFAFVSSVNVALQIVVAVNGFGLQKQIDLRRARDPADPTLQSLFVVRLRYTYASAILWLGCCLVTAVVMQNVLLIAIAPTAVWLAVEQTTIVWNGISIVDGQIQRLLPSYLYRRLPVVLSLVAASLIDAHAVWAWSLGLAFGSVLAFWRGYGSQDRWAQTLWPAKRLVTSKVSLDFGFWFQELGSQLRDLDVVAIALVSPYTAGIYALPTRLVRPMNIVTQAAGLVAFPRLVRRQSITRRELGIGLLVGNLPVVAISGLVATAAPLIPTIVGAAYADSVHPMQILCLAAAVSGTTTLLTVYLQARSSQAIHFAGGATLLLGAAQICLAAAGALVDGAVGATIGAVTAQTVLALLLLWRADRQCRSEAKDTGLN
ncbi:lipopolysaccharide biosynthesis protein [Nocardioides dilutus]